MAEKLKKKKAVTKKAAAPKAGRKPANPKFGEAELLSLRRAFETFQRQSEMLETAHADLKTKLECAQTDLAAKNRQLAATVEDLESMRSRLSGILESINDAVLTIGSDGVLRCANLAAKSFLDDCGLASNPSLVAAPALRDLLAKRRRGDAILEMPTPSGKRKYMLSALLMKHGGSSGELVVTLKDVTELMDLQERVGREDRMAALGRVAASVAHEIRNPLGAIEGFGMLLERDLKDNPNLLRLASKTVYASRQLNSVVSNLLSYTRELRVSLTPCDANALVAAALEFVNPMAADRKTQIMLEEPSRPAPVMADSRQINQVLINILMNAVEACPHRGGGVVRVSCRPSPDAKRVEIVVSDNGPGVPNSLKKRIFEPFFTTKDGGTGLGLSLCQRIVEAHKGAISESGDEGRGAVFVIELKASGAAT